MQCISRNARDERNTSLFAGTGRKRARETSRKRASRDQAENRFEPLVVLSFSHVCTRSFLLVREILCFLFLVCVRVAGGEFPGGQFLRVVFRACVWGYVLFLYGRNGCCQSVHVCVHEESERARVGNGEFTEPAQVVITTVETADAEREKTAWMFLKEGKPRVLKTTGNVIDLFVCCNSSSSLFRHAHLVFARDRRVVCLLFLCLFSLLVS